MTGESSSSHPLPPQAPSNLLIPGFCFYPTEEDLVVYYLKRIVSDLPILINVIAEVDLYKVDQWDLLTKSRFHSHDMEWYFFTPLHHKRSTHARINRTTIKGYWKTTNKDRSIRHGLRVVSMKKTLVLHLGWAPGGERTDWVMHEYRLEDEELTRSEILQDLESGSQLEDVVHIEASSSVQIKGGNSEDPSTASQHEALIDESFLDGLLMEDFLVDDWALYTGPICADGSVELQN